MQTISDETVFCGFKGHIMLIITKEIDELIVMKINNVRKFEHLELDWL